MLDQSATAVRQRLVDIVRQILDNNGIARPFTNNDQLSAAGLTSIDMVNLMLTVESEFDILIPQAEINPENFRSISTIETLLIRIKPDPSHS